MNSNFVFPQVTDATTTTIKGNNDNDTDINLQITENSRIQESQNQDNIIPTDPGNVVSSSDIRTDPSNYSYNISYQHSSIPPNNITNNHTISTTTATMIPTSTNNNEILQSSIIEFPTIDIPSPIEAPHNVKSINSDVPLTDKSDHPAVISYSDEFNIYHDQSQNIQSSQFITNPNFIQNNIDRTTTTNIGTTTTNNSNNNNNIISNEESINNVIIPINQATTAIATTVPTPTEYVNNLRHEMATERKNPSEYALHILFTKFVRQAEEKLTLCSEYPFDIEPPINNILSEGIDPNFDKIIESLGHISRKNPKPVIDAMMFWRKTKSEISNSISQDFENKLKLLEKEMSINGNNTSSSSSTVIPNSSSINSKPYPTKSNSLRKVSTSGSLSIPKRVVSLKSSPQVKSSNDTTKLIELQNIVEQKRIEMLQANRKSLISIYILCRVLIEIVKQSPHNFDEYMNTKLEEIVFAQLKITDPLSISSSIIKSSNWNSFAKILGCMSEYHFLSVSDRFIAELEKFPKIIPIEDEPYVHLLVLGMRYLKLKHYPIENFEQSVDFIKSVSKFFARTENVPIRMAYADVTTQLLLSLADVVTVEINHPTWVEAMEILYKCAKTLILNTKCWSVGFTLGVSILCVSPSQLFTERWMKLLTSNIDKIKTKDITERAIYALGLSRLVWVYLYRSTETLNNTIRTLTSLLRLYLNPKKKENWLTTDFSLINPLSDSLVFIGYLYPEFLMENAMLPLLKQSFNGVNLDITNYDKLLLAVTTYRKLLITDKKPSFPDDTAKEYLTDLNRIVITSNDPLYTNHEEICLYIYKLFLLLDSSIGSEVWSP